MLFVPRARWRNTRSPATAIDPLPPPNPVAVQTIGGPAAGQPFSNPVSFEMRVRLGPGH